MSMTQKRNRNINTHVNICRSLEGEWHNLDLDGICGSVTGFIVSDLAGGDACEATVGGKALVHTARSWNKRTDEGLQPPTESVNR